MTNGNTLRHVLELPGASIHYEVHGDPASPGPAPTLVVVGFPMGMGGFEGLASRLGDRVVVTVDPRGVGSSRRHTDDTKLLSPQDHALDLAALLDALGSGTVDMFATSGGAINALALMEHAPEKVRLLVAHEPPLTWRLPDRGVIERVNADIAATYERDGFGPAMAKFIMFVMHDGELDESYLQRPAPDPAAFGLPGLDDGRRDDPMLGGSIHNGPSYELDPAAIGAVADRILVAVGDESGETVAARGARSMAKALGLRVVGIPGDHAGFADGEHGQMGRPDEFAARLQELLAPTL